MRPRLSAALLAVASCSTLLTAQPKSLLTPKDYGRWELLGASRLSPDGAWLAFGVNRVNEENELRLRGGPRDSTITVAYAVQPTYSADSRWVAYLVGVSPKERDRLVKDKKPVRTSLVARNLRTGDTIVVDDVASFAFSADARALSMTKYPADGKKTSDVLVQSLTGGTRWMFDNVGESAWAPSGASLALTITVDGGAGNGGELFDAAAGTTRVLDASTSVYRSLSWRANATDLAVLRSRVDKEFVDTAHTILAWTNVGTPGSAPRCSLHGISTMQRWCNLAATLPSP